MSYASRKLITIGRVLDEDLFTGWELEKIRYESNEWWHFIFEYIGYLRDTKEWVYICHDPQLRQRLLESKRRSELWKKLGSARCLII